MKQLKTIRRGLPRPATVLAALALFAALAGTATAAGGLISGKTIKPGTITGKQIKNKSLALNKLSEGAVKKLSVAGPRGAEGPRGPEGSRGPQGEPGIAGPQGPAGIVAPLSGSAENTNIAEGEEKLLLTVPVGTAGTFAINAKTDLFAVQDAAKVECRLSAGGKDVDLVQWNSSEASDRQALPLQAVAAATAGGPIRLFCSFSGGNGSAFESKITAIPVS